MSSNPYELLLQELDALEGDQITLPYFNSDVAWKIGVLAKELAQEYGPAITIDVTLSNGQILFHAPSKSGVSLDNDFWINRKKKSVLRFQKSSFYLGRKLASKKDSAGNPATMENAYFVNGDEYAMHGGSVPIRASDFDGIYGAFTVSGLPQEQDHLLALRVLRIIKEELSQ